MSDERSPLKEMVIAIWQCLVTGWTAQKQDSNHVRHFDRCTDPILRVYGYGFALRKC